jgi:hypothetical protein
VRSGGRQATNSPSRCAGAIIAQFIAPAMSVHGGGRLVSTRSKSLASFGDARA